MEIVREAPTLVILARLSRLVRASLWEIVRESPTLVMLARPARLVRASLSPIPR